MQTMRGTREGEGGVEGGDNKSRGKQGGKPSGRHPVESAEKVRGRQGESGRGYLSPEWKK